MLLYLPSCMQKTDGWKINTNGGEGMTAAIIVNIIWTMAALWLNKSWSRECSEHEKLEGDMLREIERLRRGINER